MPIIKTRYFISFAQNKKKCVSTFSRRAMKFQTSAAHIFNIINQPFASALQTVHEPGL